uniref:Uncharacterized protein n=1 Tax=Arundo donax TaxID=35708 RepID=A0A0A9D740_ARUDO
MSNHLTGTRVQSWEGLAGCRINKIAIDEELCVVHLNWGRDGFLCCCCSAEPLKDRRQQSARPIWPAERRGGSGRRAGRGPGEEAAGDERGGGPPRCSGHDGFRHENLLRTNRIESNPLRRAAAQ